MSNNNDNDGNNPGGYSKLKTPNFNRKDTEATKLSEDYSYRQTMSSVNESFSRGSMMMGSFHPVRPSYDVVGVGNLDDSNALLPIPPDSSSTATGEPVSTADMVQSIRLRSRNRSHRSHSTSLSYEEGEGEKGGEINGQNGNKTKFSKPQPILKGKYRQNSYFAIRLLRLTFFILFLDATALFFYYYYGFYSINILDGLALKSNTCDTMTVLAAMIYHMFPGVIIMGLPASGFRLFEPFKREHRFDRNGRRQKVKRTIFLQVCEITGVFIFLYAAYITIIFIYTIGRQGNHSSCEDKTESYAFIAVGILLFVLVIKQIVFFSRFREHLKMQLGAFRESDQTGGFKARLLRKYTKKPTKNKTKKKPNGQNTNGVRDSTQAGSLRFQTMQYVRKRLYRASQLGDLKQLEKVIKIAQHKLGKNFGKEMYPDANIFLGLFGTSKKNPLHVAAYRGNIQAMELLFAAKFDVNSFDKMTRHRISTGEMFWYFARFFVKKPVSTAEDAVISLLKTTLVTPLHCAVSTGRVEAVKWLLDHGARVNVSSRSTYRSERLPPIFVADHPEVVKQLLLKGANQLAIPDPGHMNTVTVLQLAYLRGNYAVAQVLEEWGGDLALTPLHAAAAINDAQRVRSLLRKKLDVNCLGELGYEGLNRRTPLHWAAVNGALDTIRLLLEANADPNFQDTQGRTPLHWATRSNRVETVRCLLEKGADPNIVDEDGLTPIMCSACVANIGEDVFKVLVQYGGDINCPIQGSGDTALHIAIALDNQSTALAILSAGGDIMKTNADGFRPIDCTMNTKLQFEIKRAAGNRDVMISYTHSHKEFAMKLRKSLEDANITTWLDLMDPSGIGGGSVWREEIARGISNASLVLCILTEDYSQSEWCLKELALAKQVGTPIVAISTEGVPIGEELQVYLYTRQIIPFEPAIAAIEKENLKNILYSYDEVSYTNQFRLLLDGVRDVIEKRREEVITRNMQQRNSFVSLGTTTRRTTGIYTATGRGGSLFTRHLVDKMVLDTNGQFGAGALHSFSTRGGGALAFGGGNGIGGGTGAGIINARAFNNDTTISNETLLDNDDPTGLSLGVAGSPSREGKAIGADNKTQSALVFVSHGDFHSRFVKRLYKALRGSDKLKCYVDRRGEGDDCMAQRIHEAKEAILKCSAFVVVLSEKTLKSELVRDQLAFAEDKGKKIYPLVLNTLEIGLDAKYSLSRSDLFHFMVNEDMGFNGSLNRLQDQLSRDIFGPIENHHVQYADGITGGHGATNNDIFYGYDYLNPNAYGPGFVPAADLSLSRSMISNFSVLQTIEDDDVDDDFDEGEIDIDTELAADLEANPYDSVKAITILE